MGSPKKKPDIKEIVKWVFQFLLSSFFAYAVIVYLNPRGSMGTQMQFMVPRIPLAVTLGIVLADVSIYTTRKFSFAAALASVGLAVPSFFLAGILFSVYTTNPIFKIILYIFFFSVLVLPSLTTYNLFSNLKRAKSPGNILLDKGEANLPKKSVINITQIYTVNKADLIEKIGQVSEKRVKQLLDGIRFLMEPREL